MKIFLKKKEDYLNDLKKGENQFEIKQSVIHLNVGGKFFTVSKETLLKAEGTMFGAMVCGRYEPGPKDKEGRYFIDRPFKPFSTILNCLRSNSKIVWPEDESEERILKTEIKYYGMVDFFKTWQKKK